MSADPGMSSVVPLSRIPKIVGVVQAGGQGSRMDVLTRERAKPALPFAGSYQLVDFALSNFGNSGIPDVWVSVQYEASSLDRHLAGGRPWDLDRTRGGYRRLVPEEGQASGSEGFSTGNADDLLKIGAQLREAGAEVVVVTSADQVYRLDMRAVVAQHLERGSEATIVTVEVPLAQAKHKTVVDVGRDGVVDIAQFSQLPLHELLSVIEAAVVAAESATDGAGDESRASGGAVEKLAATVRLGTGLVDRIRPIIDLGLGYLSLDRTSPTLSGGELQRLRLATQLTSELFGVVYVLDEPSAGLHPQDVSALLDVLQGLKKRGNSLFIVEHSVDVMRRADWLVDIGPAAGERGGRVIYSGPTEGLADVEESATRDYLFGGNGLPLHEPRKPHGWLRLEKISRNNLRSISVEIPLGALTAVTGVSGSGKSSLVSQVLPTLVSEHLGRPVTTDEPVPDGDDMLLSDGPQELEGSVAGDLTGVRRVVTIDQKPIGRTPRSNVATYTGLFDHVRRRFAETPESRARGYKPGRFSFNVAGGRCPTCEGEGSVMVELLFLPSVYTECPECHGTRYQSSTLEILWRGRNIAEILAMSVEDAHEFFEGEVDIMRSLTALLDVGLGYLRLGQPATELSGGEAQRVKLGSELQRAQSGDTLYVLDEPTSGLHCADTDRLVAHLQSLVDAGNTVVMVELDMRVIAQSDHVIDLGPGAGGDGGQVVAAGTPPEVAGSSTSASARYLATALEEAAAVSRVDTVVA